ncbi:unnamed protein product [Protopolystoma xenopodis]|uniref:Uncharacterized protein n=1 Tax=Protopolystoma xenopodis TaxID=117903 RepID=A0A3S5B1P5_9PLAT|nr:unnamed protein product [Protopolystoma xenopodis]
MLDTRIRLRKIDYISSSLSRSEDQIDKNLLLQQLSDALVLPRSSLLRLVGLLLAHLAHSDRVMTTLGPALAPLLSLARHDYGLSIVLEYVYFVVIAISFTFP